MLIFSYGTLTLPLVRDRVLGHPAETRDAVLRGHVKVCAWDYLTVVPSDGDVTGVVFEADDEDVRRMDVWEDVPAYVLTPVRVEVGGEEVDACAYIMPDPPACCEPVGDDRVAAIPLREIVADLERALRRRSRVF